MEKGCRDLDNTTCKVGQYDLGRNRCCTVALECGAVCLAAGAVRDMNKTNDGISSPVGSLKPRIVTEGIQIYL